MLQLKHLSVKSKLQIMLLIASLGSILVVAYLSWSKSQEIITERIFNQLTSVRSSKAYQVEAYFKTLHNQIETLCENGMVGSAMTEFDQEFQQLKQQSISAGQDQAIKSYYNQEFLPRLAKNIAGTPIFETYRPTSPESRYLQYHYIANNSHPVGKKDELDQAQDNSKYSQIHARYHSFFRNLIKRFGYYDLFLINPETGDVVYTVYKETDFSSNLYTGTYRNSNLAQVVKQVRDNPDRGATQLVDFQFYRPSYNAPAAFLAGSIYDGTKRVGILAIQLPIDEINRVLTGDRQWKQDGLGDTGETYVVGDDLRLRSAARLLIENPTKYLDVLNQNGVRSKTIRLIEQLKTSLLLHSIETNGARKSVQGKSGTQIIKGYQGSQVLSSYAPLNIQGVNWGIISEMSLSEVYAPIRSLQNYILFATIILILLVTLYATIASQRFMKPIDLMIQRSQNPQSADLSTELEITFQDEISELTKIFNGLVGQIRQITATVTQKEQENEILLLNILPRLTMERWRQGETPIVDQFAQVTIIVMQILDLQKATEERGNKTVVNSFHEWVGLLDEKADRADIERLNCFGDRYIAACGLTKPRIDHVKRSVEFAQDALNLIKEVNQKYSLNFSLRIGIHTGSITAALIGQKKFQYDIWGEPIRIANQLSQQTQANTIRVTQAVCDRVQEIFSFQPDQTIKLEDQSHLPTWGLGKADMSSLFSDITPGFDFDADDNIFNPKN
ncbi:MULTISPECIES: adenylate/guanylate cyclase domain-containing protein [Nostocales]|uniref:Adenylate/guanylate cyclase domain-containing protein n=1 Tax=Dolichospermum flos-aquae UHCC 0037 TaxID=2590026 RepID=A0ACC7SAA4_DOLFA|nr:MULTISPECIES: adenylate/guanylate cyclase domain-containing protein [Nostocales]MBO1067467.1 adenylate/guanylate cyclase domain-containing protein [Anabaena sp. 54]MTJ45440.1 adenylate/guanylate cyclase domain-containing protein [Dolichospermum flos-aquae UHCC 0037]